MAGDHSWAGEQFERGAGMAVADLNARGDAIQAPPPTHGTALACRQGLMVADHVRGAPVARGALTAMIQAHERALATLRARAFTSVEARAIGSSAPTEGSGIQTTPVARTKP